MTQNYGANRALAAIVFFLLAGGIIMMFPLDQLWTGIAVFVVGLIIIVFKITWCIAVWADDSIRRWSDRNLAPKDSVDVTFRVREEDDEKP